MYIFIIWSWIGSILRKKLYKLFIMKSRYLLCEYLHNQFPRTNDIKKQMKELNCDLYGFYPRKKNKGIAWFSIFNLYK